MDIDIKPVFSNRLKECRKKAGLNQAALAEFCGTTQSAISSFESGNAAPNLEIAALLAEKFEVSLDWLCGLGEGTHSITPLQWLCYTERLISAPPKIQHKAIVRFQNSGQQIDNKPVATLSFYGEKLHQFFTAYAAIRGTREQVGKEVYESLVNTLFEKYSAFFTSGYEEWTEGAHTATPPWNVG